MYNKGDRVELVRTSDPYTKLEPGDTGTVTGVDVDPPEITPSGRPEKKVWIDWDDGGHLALVIGEDKFRRIRD